jgi:putative phage-type endonuclease
MNNAPQRTEAWHTARLGKVTASRVADVIAKTKSGYGASRANLMADLICERLTGQPASTFTNAHMEWGTEQEPHARAAYSARTGELVEEVGFINHPRIANSGASPDGLVGDDGLVEFKCPATSTMLDTLLAGEVPSKYIPQMQWQMACTGRKWCDFCSYDPRLPEHLRMFVKRVERDDDYIKMLEGEVTVFLAELEEKLSKLQELNRG